MTWRLRQLVRLPALTLDRVLRAGVDRAPDPRARRRVFVNNGIALICMGLSCCVTLFVLSLGVAFMLPRQILMLAVYGMVIGLNHAGYFKLSKLTLMVSLSTAIFTSFIAIGLKGQVSALYAAACLPLLMCDLEERGLIVAGAALPITYAMLLATGVDIGVAPRPIAPEVVQALRIVVVIVTFAGLIGTVLFFVLSNDRAERQLESAHAEMRRLLDGIDQGIVTLNRFGRVGPERSAMFDVWFATPAIDTPFEHCLARLDATAADAFARGWAEITGRPGASDGMNLALPSLLQAGSRHYSLRYKAMLQDGRFAGAMLVMSDVTLEEENRRSEAGRRQLEADLAHVRKLEAVGQLAAGVAHEINTPAQFVSDNVRFLSSACTALEKLVNAYRRLWPALTSSPEHAALRDEIVAVEREADLEYLAHNIPDACESAVEGVVRISNFVGALREFARPGTVAKRPADVNHALHIALTLVRSEYKEVAELETEFGKLPLVACHVDDLNRAFLNLLVNAAQAVAEVAHVSAQRGVVRVRTWAADDSSTVGIEIADTGCGIDQAIRHRVFDLFFTTKQLGQATGQGLAIARNVVVNKHQGSLTFESEVGKGTTFRVILPVRAGADATARDSQRVAMV
ncbi:MAG TPA: ATP-binding protein [Polyangiales bacterium]|nr:ATP-binding protein [Polyangiales bacterium]